MRFVRVEDPNRLNKEFKKLLKESNSTDDKLSEQFLKQFEQFDPYRLGVLTLNNDSDYNREAIEKGLIKARAPVMEERPSKDDL